MAARPVLSKLRREELSAERLARDKETMGMTMDTMRFRLKHLYVANGDPTQKMPYLNERKDEVQEKCIHLDITCTTGMTRGELPLAMKDYWGHKLEISKDGDSIGFGTRKDLAY